MACGPRFWVSAPVIVVVIAVLTPAASQGGQVGPAQSWSPPRTPDGQPDIQGVWTNFDSTPFEAPSAEVWKDLDALAIWF